MSSKMRLVCVILCAIFFVAPAIAGQGMLYGNEKWLWETSFLIVARVSDVRAVGVEDHDRESSHILVLEPLATIAGHLDASRQSGIQVTLCTEPFGSVIRKAPAKGETILVVISSGNIEGDENRPDFFICPDACRFMPGRTGYVVVHDMADKTIFETLKKLREIRHTEAATTTRPSEEKARE